MPIRHPYNTTHAIVYVSKLSAGASGGRRTFNFPHVFRSCCCDPRVPYPHSCTVSALHHLHEGVDGNQKGLHRSHIAAHYLNILGDAAAAQQAGQGPPANEWVQHMVAVNG
jgi:hypothetical protein